MHNDKIYLDKRNYFQYYTDNRVHQENVNKLTGWLAKAEKQQVAIMYEPLSSSYSSSQTTTTLPHVYLTGGQHQSSRWHEPQPSNIKNNLCL